MLRFFLFQQIVADRNAPADIRTITHIHIEFRRTKYSHKVITKGNVQQINNEIELVVLNANRNEKRNEIN